MSAFLRRYATATHVYIPLIKRGAVDFAVGADWTPDAGDVKVSIDGGAVANIATLPVAIASGNAAFWDFELSSGETTGKKITVTVVDAATKAIEDQAFLIETYGHASAEYALDLGINQSGDSFARLGSPAGASVSADIATRASQASVDDLPTNAELSTALNAADDATLAAIAALNDLDAAGIRAALGMASADLDTQLDAIKAVVDRLELGKVTGTAATGTLTTTSISTSLTGFLSDSLIGRVVIFVGGDLIGYARRISDYESASGVITWTEALPSPPANGDSIVVV